MGLRYWAVVAAVGALLAVSGCGSTSTTLVGPGDGRCDVSLSGSTSSFGAAGGSGSIAVVTARECAWSVETDADWIAITSARTGQGSGRVEFRAASNASPFVRQGGIVVGESRVDVTQTGVPCAFTLSSAAESFGAGGGERTVAVETLDGCEWTTESQQPWIVVAGGGDGSGTVRLSVAANEGAPRAGVVTIADLSVSVAQEATCQGYTLDGTGREVPVGGETFTVRVATQAWCAWTAASSEPWMVVTSGADGTGNGAVTVAVAPNAGAPRTGTLMIAGQPYVVTQAASCTYALSPTSENVGIFGGTRTVQVLTQGWCHWTATSEAAWVTIVSGGVGTGSGQVTYQVAPGLATVRGTIRVDDQVLTITRSFF